MKYVAIIFTLLILAYVSWKEEIRSYYLERSYFERIANCDKKSNSGQNLGSDSAHYRKEVAKGLNKKKEYVWLANKRFLGETCYQVAVGPYVTYESGQEIAEIFAVSVEFREGMHKKGGDNDGGWFVKFHKNYDMRDLPNDILSKDIDEIVKYSEQSKEVSFLIGPDEQKYRLQKP